MVSSSFVLGDFFEHVEYLLCLVTGVGVVTVIGQDLLVQQC